MALHDEHADILGGPILQRPQSSFLATFSQYNFVFKSFALVGLGLLVWIACARGLEHLKRHRELMYRKAMRRKHGIPDSDCRPFAVAYAAAKRAHLDREAQDRKKTTNYVSNHNPPVVDQRTDAQRVPRGLRKRVPETIVQHHHYQPPEKHASLYSNKRPDAHPLDFTSRYNPDLRHRVAITEAPFVEGAPVCYGSRKDFLINLGDHEESRKRSFDDESDVEQETIKKSRMDDDKPVNGNEQSDWYAQYSDIPPRRSSKESLGQQPEDNYVHMNGQEISKRVNDLRDEDHEPVDEAMEGIDEDEVTELKAVARGRKRDRAEAGSTFGGDDEEDIWNGRPSHHHKRRTILQRRTETPARGQKRDRGTESPESEGEVVGSKISQRRAQRSSKKKRDKKAFCDETNEISMGDSRVSEDPLCGGRRVGDEWEADGVQYKVGSAGERLRLTLVKKARNKYYMPQDSQHPDRSAALEIYVETWVTEAQYKIAEGKQELAWQEAPNESTGSKTPPVLDSPTKSGKSLLWDSVKGSPARRTFRQSTPAASARINPFEQWQLQPTPGRRVASSSITVSPILRGVADSPTRPGFRGFSKWEKQDREAEAMARIRAKMEEQKKTQGSPEKPAELSSSTTAPELGARPLSVPTITLTPPSVVAATGKSDDSIPTGKTNTSIFSPSSTSDPTKDTIVTGPTTTPGFSLLSPSIPVPTSSTHSPSAATVPTPTSSVIPPALFSFAKPPQVSSSTSIASSPGVPTFFAKGPGAGMPSSSTASLSTVGTMTQPQPPATESAIKPTLFSFAKPDASSSAAYPAVVPPAATKSQVPALSATSNSSSSPMIFGPTLATKQEVPGPLPNATSVAMPDSLKPTAPLFSFSNASSPLTTTTPPTSSTSSAPKFSFGQPPTTLAPPSGTASQPKPTFKFGQTLPGATNTTSLSALPATDESKKSVVPVSVFGPIAGLDEPSKPSLFATFGSSTSSSPPTIPFGKPVALDSDISTSLQPKSSLGSASNTAFSKHSSTPVGAATSANAPVFSFGGTNTGSKSSEEPRPPSLFGDAAGSKPVSMFGASSADGKPTFTFSPSAAGSKPTFTFGSNKESSKTPSVLGSSTEAPKPIFAFGGSSETSKPASVEGPKSAPALSGTTQNKSTSGPATESPKSTAFLAGPSDNILPSNTIDPSKPTLTPGSTPFALSSPSSTFAFERKDDVITNTPTSTSTQPTPASPFAFGVPPNATGSTFGHPPTFVTNGDSSQSSFGKPPNVTPSAFGFGVAGTSSSPSTFTFGKPATQNQKQEQ